MVGFSAVRFSGLQALQCLPPARKREARSTHQSGLQCSRSGPAWEDCPAASLAPGGRLGGLQFGLT